MMNKVMHRMIQEENNALITFFEKNAIQNRTPLDLCFLTMIETFWIVAEKSYQESQITITFKAIPKDINDILHSSFENIYSQMNFNFNDLEQKSIEMDFDDHCCQECVHLYFDNSCQKCIYLIQTYSIQDCIRYNPNEYNTATTVDYTLPSAFKCSFIINPTSRNNCTSALTVTTANGTIYVGQYSSDGTNGIYTSSGQSTGTVSILNTEQECVWEYSNGVHTFTLNGHTVTVNGYAPSKITTLGASSNNHLKQLKVKPL